jgi:lambda family phage portal protein
VSAATATKAPARRSSSKRVNVEALAKAYSRGYDRGVQARFDAAETTPDNARHWAAVTWSDADAEASSSVRRTLRSRARYEVANNSYARGIVLTLANDAVGTGPTLQMRLADADLCAQIERDFLVWSEAIGLPEKLRTMRMARCQDGEAFAIFAKNPRTGFDRVMLDLRLVEADRVAGSWEDAEAMDPLECDGIRFDRFGNPLSYRVLRYHPGAAYAFGAGEEADWYAARDVVHLFREDRPEQHRGVPEITPALPLFAQLRRYTLAVLAAAESAADFAAVLYTDQPADQAADVTPLEAVRLHRNLMTTLPEGWKLDQLDPKQPASNYREFKQEILNEIARCLNIPFNVAACNSSGYNYASGRLDHQTYFRSIRIEQDYIERKLLDPLFRRWLREWGLATGKSLDVTQDSFVWFWDGAEHVDPSKEARAQNIRLLNGTTTLAAEFAKQGKDWEAETRQRAREIALCRELGVPLPGEVPQSEPSDEPQTAE